MAPKGNMSHAEIWDDSALVNSWNDALEEYKKYHSIAARGENVEEVLTRAESGKYGEHEEMKVDEVVQNDHPIATSVPSKKTASEENTTDRKNEHRDSFQTQETAPSSQEPERKQPALPQHLIGQVHDEGLKNLLMSWYYAGYYTGLYEGQQQGKGFKDVGNQEGR